MASIGKLGRKRPDIVLDFDYFGETIRVNPKASDLQFAAFMKKAVGIDLVGVDTVEDLRNNPDAQRFMVEANDETMKYLEQLIHPDDWPQFWKTALGNGQMMLDVLTDAQAIVEAVANFHTGQSSDSSGGQSTTGPKSPENSSSAAPTPAMSAGHPPVQLSKQDRITTKALQLTEGHALAQEVIWMAYEHRRAVEETPDRQHEMREIQAALS